MKQGLFSQASHCLLLADPKAKCDAVDKLSADYLAGLLVSDEGCPVPSVHHPGRPIAPELVEPSRVARRRLGNIQGRVALLHAIAHIEFNAINLALDAVCRFRGMPDQYYADWISVAADEARHFSMLIIRLNEFDAAYGDLCAHNGLWEMAEKTADSCLVRMALVPRVLEARGLDVTPGMIRRLSGVGDSQTIEVLETILAEEVRHVAIGTRWFKYCCELEGKEPDSTFLGLIETHYTGKVRGPFNTSARMEAGFSDTEMAALEAAQ